MAGDWARELKKGSIQLCLLAMLSEGRKYGFEIIKELRARTGGYYDLAEGTLYPALHRLQKQGLLASERVIQEDRPPRKYYTLTVRGQEALVHARREWEMMTTACNALLGRSGPSGSVGTGSDQMREVDEDG